MRFVVLDDDARDVESIHSALAADGLDLEIVHVTDLLALQQALNRAPADAVLADYWPPRGDGLAALRMVRDEYPSLPFIFVSDALGEEQVIDMLKLGATDFVAKDRLSRLAPAVRRALREVEERRARLRAEAMRERFYSLSPDLFCITDFEGRIVDVNSAWDTLLGWKRAELLAQPPFEWVHPDDRDAADDVLRRVVAGERMGQFEQRCRARDGSWRWVQWTVSADVHARRVYAAGRDATPRMEIERELATRVEQQAAVARFAARALRGGDISALCDDAARTAAHTLHTEIGVVLERCAASGELAIVAQIGVERRELDGLETAGPRSLLAFALRHGEPVRVDDWDKESRFEPPRPRRELGLHSGMCVVVRADDGAYGALAVHARERRRYSDDDAHFLASVANLLAAAIQRTRSEQALAKSQDQLRHAQKLEAVGQLAGGVAHDFNNQLTAILGYAELVESEVDPSGVGRKYLNQIRQAADRATALTQQLLAFGRRQVLAPRPVDLNSEVRHMQVLLERSLGEDVQLVLSLAPDLRTVKVDPGQIQQVLLNLVVNARDALPDGGRIEVETRNVDVAAQGNGAAPVPPGAWVVLAVHDDGAGIDPSVLPRIFEPFFTTKPAGKGTGMGLATVQGVVEQSGGVITVASEFGRGATFSVYLPQVAAEVPPALPRQRVERPTSGSETILIAEDDAALRALAREVLGSRGYTVLEAANGIEALALAEQYPSRIDLVIADLVMPHMGGDKLERALGAHCPKAKWLYMSGFASHAIVERHLAELHTAFLAKPFNADQLLRRVRAILDGVPA